jgi:tetratricopeptide (TPR) repeat protein
MRSAPLLSLFLVLLSCGQPDPKPAETKTSIQLKSTTSVDGNAALSYKTSADFQVAKPGETFQSGTTLKTSDNGQASFTTPFSKRLELNSGTELSLISNNLRLSQGEIFLDTSPGEPLLIELPQGKVTIEGAAVNIKQQSKGAEINVLKGNVNIESPKGNLALVSAEGAFISPDGDAKKGPSADFTSLTEWTTTLQRAIEPSSQTATSEDTPPPPGFGTLSAKTPGTTKERPFLLLSQNVTVTIEGELARTEVEEVFENPSDVVVEGSFKFTLPEGASVTRYAMYVKDTLMEGEIVEREEGRQILRHMINEYLAEQARLRDPALVEWTSGNTFSTRIFPILPREKKRIILAYSQRLDTQEGVTRYVYPLAAAGARDKVGAFKLNATFVDDKRGITAPLYPAKIEARGNDQIVSFEANQFQAPADFVLKIEEESKQRHNVVTSIGDKGEPNYFMLSLLPTMTGANKRSTDDWIILVDSSQSRTANEMAIQRGLLPVLFGSLDYEARVRVFSYDYTAKEVTDGWTQVTDELSAQLEEKLQAITPAGATNLSLAIEAAAKASEGKPVRVLMLGDLAPTVGELRPEALSAQVRNSFAKGSTLSTVGVGSVDDLMLEALPGSIGGVPYRISDGEDLSLAAMRILSSQLRPVLSDIVVTIDGIEASDVFPAKVSSLPMGRALTLLGRYKIEKEATIHITGKIGQEPFKETIQLALSKPNNSQLLAPLWAKEKIDALTERSDKNAIQEIKALSKSFGIMSRYTSYIVLENDAMYREFGIEQKKKTTTGDSTAKARKKAEEETLNAGIVSTIAGDGSNGSPFASVFGREDAVGNDSENILGGLLGDRPGEAEGGFGLGLRGTGVGGGGKSSGVGAVSLEKSDASPSKASNQSSSGGNNSAGIGRGSASFNSRAGTPNVTMGIANIKGSLDKEIIRRVLRRAMPGIKFCYEQALQINPSLEGKVKIFFIIAPNGAVSSASPLSGIQTDVDSCVARKISQLSFPAPQGGGIVEITYPFTFEPTGGAPQATWSSSPKSQLGRSPFNQDQEATIQTDEKKPSESQEKKLAELRILLDKDPMVRGNHKKLVSQMIAMNMHKEALEAAIVWRRLDGANVDLLKTISGLYRLNGRADEAVRMYSGVLDIDPEASIVVEVLASYAEAKGRFEESYQLRLARTERKLDDTNAQLDLIEASIKAKHTEEATRLLSGWIKTDAKGKVSTTGKLSGAQKNRVLSLYKNISGESTSSKVEDSKRAEILIEASWEGDADLDLWIIGPNGRAIFGDGFQESAGKNVEKLILPKASMGKYQVIVFDASTKRPSKDTNVKVLLHGFKGAVGEKKKEISVSVPPNSGAEVGTIELSRPEIFGFGFGFGG